jgi:hypothetical protein
MDYRPPSWLDRLTGTCAVMLVAAWMVFLTMRLLMAVWIPLLITAAAVTTIVVVLAVLRWRRQGW